MKFFYPIQNGSYIKDDESPNIHHSGNEFALDFDIPENTPLYAITDGKVTKAKSTDEFNNYSTGKCVSISFTMPGVTGQLFATYMHMNRVDVKEGDLVTIGQQIGLSGNTGDSTGPHLHLQILRDSEFGDTGGVTVYRKTFDNEEYRISPEKDSLPLIEKLFRYLKVKKVGGDVKNVPETSLAAVAWNWLANANIPEVSSSPEAIAGIIGNFMQETGGGEYNLQAMGYGNGFYGMWCESNSGLRTAIKEAGLSGLWYPYFNRNIDFETEKPSVGVELNWLTKSSDSWLNFYLPSFNKVSSKTGIPGARAYAELFCVCVERCINGSGELEDLGVIQAMKDYYGGSYYLYQDLENRRRYAEKVYQEFYLNS